MIRRLAPALLLCASLTAAGCSDNDPTAPTALKRMEAQAVKVAVVDGLPNTVEGLITALYDRLAGKILVAAWRVVLVAKQRGHLAEAQRGMFVIAEITVFKQKRGFLNDPDGSGPATVDMAVTKLFSLMFGATHPGTPPPPQVTVGDGIVTLVDGNAQATTTPAKLAGIEIAQGSTRNPFFLVIDEDPREYPGRCEGPLNTTLCQFPLFYRFTPYPHTTLLKKARFAVCSFGNHEDQDRHERGPKSEVQHDRLRLAHNGKDGGIKIMDYVDVTLPLDCDRATYPFPPPLVTGSLDPRGRAATYANALTRAIAKVLTPKNAYAIDRGGGGEDDFFSSFNLVDPGETRAADLTASQVSATPSSGLPGSSFTLTYAIANVGTANAGAFSNRVVLATNAALTQGVTPLFSNTLPSLAANTLNSATQTFQVPNVAAGTYYVGVVVDTLAAVAESDETNNVASVAFDVLAAAPPEDASFVGIWNGTVTSPTEQVQPVTIIVTSQDGSAAIGEFRVAEAGETVAYNDGGLRFFTNGLVSGATLTFSLQEGTTGGEFSLTRSEDALTGTVVEIVGELRTTWALSLTLGTEAAISPPPDFAKSGLRASGSVSASVQSARKLLRP